MTRPADCYYKNGEVHCTNAKKKKIDDLVNGAPDNGWKLNGCFCVDADCTIAKCDGSECGKFAVFINEDDCEVIIIPDPGFCT